MDLNADLGEGCGDDAAMLDIVTSANIACGGHAGDDDTMRATSKHALAKGAVIGAHPGFADPEHFGRRRLDMSASEISGLIAGQIDALTARSDEVGAKIRYVKPHGALANWAAEDADVANAVLEGVRGAGGLPVLAMAGSALEAQARRSDHRVFSEIFADRAYTTDGRLAPRSEAGAVLHHPDVIIERLQRYLDTGEMPTLGGDPVQLEAASICVHGDTPGAVEIARAVRNALTDAGVQIASFLPHA